MIKKIHTYIYYSILTLLFICTIHVNSVVAQQENTRISNEPMTLTLYPIPSDSKVNIRFSNTLKDKVAKVEIVNVIGRKLREQTIVDKSTTEVSFNNLSDMPQGVYMIIAKDEYGKILQSTRLLINR
jgi:hypothetical protein